MHMYIRLYMFELCICRLFIWPKRCGASVSGIARSCSTCRNLCPRENNVRNSDKLFAQPIRKPAYLWMMTSRRAFDDNICKSQPVSFLVFVFLVGLRDFWGSVRMRYLTVSWGERFQKKWFTTSLRETVFSDRSLPIPDYGISPLMASCCDCHLTCFLRVQSAKMWPWNFLLWRVCNHVLTTQTLGISFSLQNYSSLLLYLLKIPRGVGPNKKSLI